MRSIFLFLILVSVPFARGADVLPCECIHDMPVSRLKSSLAPPERSSSSPKSNGIAPIIDLIAFYNEAARDVAGGDAAAIDKIQASVAYANEAYENSGLLGRVRLLAIEPVNYNYPEDETFNRALDELEDPSDGSLDALIERQRFYGADAVTLFLASSRSGGRANILTLDSTPAPYSIVRMQNPDSTLAHELGHNMGLRHREETYSTEVTRWFPDSFAEIFTTPGGANYATVMANTSDFQSVGATRVPVFSSPSVLFEGGITGNDDADNVRAMRESMPYIAGLTPARPPADSQIFAITTNGRTQSIVTLENGYPERSYSLQISGDLKEWISIGTTVTTDANGNASRRGGGGSSLPIRYYRWELLPQ